MDEPDWKYLLSEQVRLHSRLFYLLARRILRDEAGAQDACQQAFKQAWEHRARIDARRLTSWIAATVRTECLQRIRRIDIERRVLGNHSIIQPGFDDPRPSEDLRESIASAVGRLPEPLRTIIRMKYWDGMSSQEIRIALKCSHSDLWRQMQRAMEELRVYLPDWRHDRDV